MSYAKAMKWHKKHPRGIRNLYLGFDTASAPEISTEAQIRQFHRAKYLPFHKKNGTTVEIVQSEDDYVKSSLEQQRRASEKWEALNR